jgi:hypothetical protein
MKTQQNAIINKLDLFKQPLKAFLEKAANQLWNQQIEVEFYLKADGTTTYTYPGSKIIYVNLQSKQMNDFVELFNYGKQSLNSFDHKNFSFLMCWIEILASELTHIQESYDCQSTHDANFRKKIADFLLKTFIQKDDTELPIWEIFKTAAAPSKNPPAKRYKKEVQAHSTTI